MNLFKQLEDRSYTGLKRFTSRCSNGADQPAEIIHHPSFLSSVYSNESLVGRLQITHQLRKHTGCVNTVAWSDCGQYILTGSDDTNVCIWDWHADGKLQACFGTGHTANIFCAKFLPFTNNSRIITCAGDAVINVFDLEASLALRERYVQYKCHYGSVKRLVPYAESPHLFLRRDRTQNPATLVSHRKLDINSIDKSGDFFVIGTNDPLVRVYDLRMYTEPAAMFCPAPLAHLIAGRQETYWGKGHITGVCFSNNEILASYSGDGVYLFDLNETTPYTPARNANEEPASILTEKENKKSREQCEMEEDKIGDAPELDESSEDLPKLVAEEEDGETETECEHASRANTYKAKYDGHCNQRTVKSTAFFGAGDEYVLSGSDDGNIFIWDKKTARLVNLLKGDECVVNVLQGHPFNPVLATVGIDHTVKVLQPVRAERNPMANEEALDSPARPMSISLALLRRLLRAANSGQLDLDDILLASDDTEGDDNQDDSEDGSTEEHALPQQRCDTQ